ncbi:hypothetical protein PHISCL_06626 [Aspergillus sclerotialis]|uniref:Uncharacterized protein n=1 Tax=Aspergillus sclerotialis TaxID=2070753 RepID=A0A3A2ZVH7_9EURO|nr:hypothetical protein PHISCL_06626 [Aspergillus sclerotialis]
MEPSVPSYQVFSAATIARGEFTNITDVDAVHRLATAFSPELAHLKNASATVESGSMIPQGCLGPENETPSRLLLKEDFPEVNRTLISLLGLKWLLQDDYESFTSGQKADTRLTTESFRRLREFYLTRLPGPDDIYALLVLMVIDDIGKDHRLLDMVTQATDDSNATNHSDVVFEAAKLGLIPAVGTLPANYQSDVLVALDLGSKLNISQLAQAENIPASLNGLSGLQGYKRAWDLRFMATFLDVAGAAAHASARGCVAMTEAVFQAYITTINILEDFVHGRISSQLVCYNSILEARADALIQDGFVPLSTSSDDDRALLRLLCMGRVASKDQAGLFQQAFHGLPLALKHDLVNGLNVNGLSDGVGVIPYYAPGLLAVALRNTTDKADASLIRAIQAFMRFLARVYDGLRPEPGAPSGVIERDLSFAQDTIKSDTFRENPDILDETSLPWKQ